MSSETLGGLVFILIGLGVLFLGAALISYKPNHIGKGGHFDSPSDIDKKKTEINRAQEKIDKARELNNFYRGKTGEEDHE